MPSASQATPTRGVPTDTKGPDLRPVRPAAHIARGGFARRCGTCDVGYYSLWGQCHECGPDALVVFLSRAVPALGALAVTSFFFYGGELALPRRSAAIACGGAYPCYKWYVDGLERCVCRAAESNSRLLVMVPFMDTVICVIVPRLVECRSNVAPLSGGLARSRDRTRSRLQLQVLATLSSLSGISYPSHVQEAISVAKLANLDLVRSAEHLHVSARKRIGLVIVSCCGRVFFNPTATHIRAPTTSRRTLPFSPCRFSSCSSLRAFEGCSGP